MRCYSKPMAFLLRAWQNAEPHAQSARRHYGYLGDTTPHVSLFKEIEWSP